MQWLGIHYGDSFASIAQMAMSQTVIVVSAKGGWLVNHMDVKLAFLNGDLEEEVYVEQPFDFQRNSVSTKEGFAWP